MKKFVKRRFLPFLAVLAVLIGTLILPIGAEIDWLSYPASNHLDFSQVYNYGGHNATLVKDEENQTVTITPTSSSDPYVWVLYDYQLEPETRYTMSMVGTSTYNYYIFFTDGTYVGSSSGTGTIYFTFVTTSDGLIRLRVDTGGSSAVTYGQFMLAKGATKYPYQPYIASEIDSSYSAGYDQATYDASLVDEMLAKASSITLGYTMASTDSTVHPIEPYGWYRFTFDELQAQSWYENGVVNVSRFLYEDDAVPTESLCIKRFYMTVYFTESIRLTGNSILLTGPTGGFLTAYGNNGAHFSEAYTTSIAELIRPVDFQDVPFISEIRFNVASSPNIDTILGSYISTELPDFQISFVENGTYAEGYLSGFEEGKNSIVGTVLLQEKYLEGVKAGRTQGYYEGKADGMAIAETGDWTNLFSAIIDAPVKAFSSLFSFELLGLPMLDFAKSLLTMCLVIAIVKFFV